MPTLDHIFRKYRDMVFRICSRYCRDRAEAEDVTQEVFLRIDRALPAFRGDADLGSWIYRLAVNRCLDHLRSIKARNRLSEAYLDSLVARNLDCEGDRIHAKIELERILGQILPRTRKILFLVLAEGLSYREAGEVLGVSREMVAKTVRRFLEKSRPRNAVPSIRKGKTPEMSPIAGPDASKVADGVRPGKAGMGFYEPRNADA